MGEINRLSLLIISAATRLVAAFLYIFAKYILQFMEFERKYFVMSKKNSTFVAERRRRRNGWKSSKSFRRTEGAVLKGGKGKSETNITY